MRITPYELSHLILRFEQEKDMKPMHCVQTLGALRDLVDAYAAIAEKDREIQECDRINYESNEAIRKLEAENERLNDERKFGDAALKGEMDKLEAENEHLRQQIKIIRGYADDCGDEKVVDWCDEALKDGQ